MLAAFAPNSASFYAHADFEDLAPFIKDPNRTIETSDDPEQVKLAMGCSGTRGGYKVQSLVGLYWSAPYLHDGGVAVGPDTTRDLGVGNTLVKNIAPDPANSLRAMIDRDLRGRVVEANESNPISAP
jgi:hypothetical protein